MDGATLDDAILITVAALVGIIPQGLVLLTSAFLPLPARLAKDHVLVQQSYCIEALARVDALCLDKTGTITTGRMEVSHVKPASGHTVGEVDRALAEVVRASEGDANDTAQALLAHAHKAGVERGGAPLRVVPFNSRRKCSGCVTAGGQAIVLGAARFVLDEKGVAQAADLAAGFNPASAFLSSARSRASTARVHPLARPRFSAWLAFRTTSAPRPHRHALLHRAGRRPARHLW